MINIVRKGIYPIPQKTRKCPVCGEYAQSYRLEYVLDANPINNLSSVPANFNYIQKYPTFTCDNCQTVWQYLGEKEEEKV